MNDFLYPLQVGVGWRGCMANVVVSDTPKIFPKSEETCTVKLVHTGKHAEVLGELDFVRRDERSVVAAIEKLGPGVGRVLDREADRRAKLLG